MQPSLLRNSPCLGVSFNWRSCRYILAFFHPCFGATSLFGLADVGIWPSSFHRCGERSGLLKQSKPRDMKPRIVVLGRPRLLCLFKLLASCQTQVSSLCWKFSLCAGHWHCLWKQLHFPPKTELSKTSLCFAWIADVLSTISVITGKIWIKFNTHILAWTLLVLLCSQTPIKTIIKIAVVITVVCTRAC